MKNNFLKLTAFTLAAATAVLGFTACGKGKADDGTLSIVNVSYDPTRELYVAYNEAFKAHWESEHDTKVEITQSHGGSGKQALEVANGNPADVVTLALEYDVKAIQDAGLIEDGWINEFPLDSSPYTSTIVFLVRKGNPKNIKDWGDHVNGDVGIITPNPKTSGGARWNYLAAWAWADKEYGGDEEKITDYIKKLYANVLVLDSGARGATNSFVENKQGDVLLAWENEAFLSLKEYPDEYEIVTPSISILAQPSVAIVDSVVDKKGTREVATEYLNYLYSEEAQRIAGENFYRPSNEKILAEFSDVFDLSLDLVTINDFGGWDAAYEKHFADGGVFDRIYEQ